MWTELEEVDEPSGQDLIISVTNSEWMGTQPFMERLCRGCMSPEWCDTGSIFLWYIEVVQGDGNELT